jgi:hypothetical protein
MPSFLSLDSSPILSARTLSGLIDFMATSKLRLTFIMLPVIWRIVTAVCTRPATASTREESCRRLSFSFCLRTAFWAYMRAMSPWPCFIACTFVWSDRTWYTENAHVYLFELCLLCLLFLASFERLPVQRLCGELPDVSYLRATGWEQHAFRLKRAFSRPDMLKSVRCE